MGSCARAKVLGRHRVARAHLASVAMYQERHYRQGSAGSPKALRKVFTFVAKKIFDRSLTAGKAWQAAGVTDRSPLFKAFTETTLGRYIGARRIEGAESTHSCASRAGR